MLSTEQKQGRLRYANNLLPTSRGTLASRPGAVQVVEGDIAAAQPWGNYALLERAGRIVLWNGSSTIDIDQAGRVLRAATFQALTGDAKRENRLYVADGTRPLWYIARRAGSFQRYGIANKVKDPKGLTYPLDPADCVATWRGRLWFGYGTNRVQHCQFDDPDFWDPLWTPECQGEQPDRVVAITPHGETLLVGLQKSVWDITGESQFNFRTNQRADDGVAGPNAMVSDTRRAFWASTAGLHQLGAEGSLSEDIKEVFLGGPYPADIAIDSKRRLLLLLVAGRLFVMHLERPGQFGEITGHSFRGLIKLQGYVGWFGSDGLWILGGRDMPDKRLDGSAVDFESLYDTWEDIPNIDNGGRAVLQRTVMVVKGSSRSTARYRVTVNGDTSFETTLALTDRPVEQWGDQIAGLKGEPWPSEPVRHEMAPYLAGTRFRHALSAACHLELEAFEPKYKYAGARA